MLTVKIKRKFSRFDIRGSKREARKTPVIALHEGRQLVGGVTSYWFIIAFITRLLTKSGLQFNQLQKIVNGF